MVVGLKSPMETFMQKTSCFPFLFLHPPAFVLLMNVFKEHCKNIKEGKKERPENK